MHIGMHVGGVDIVFLVPRGRREYHIAEQRGGRHAEISCDQQVEFALRRPVMPCNLIGASFAGLLHTQDIVMGTKKVFLEVLTALS